MPTNSYIPNQSKNEEVRGNNLGKRSKVELRYRAFYFSLKVIRLLEKLEIRTALRIISDQLIRAVTSIGANCVEARAASSKRDFLNFHQIALKSAFETKYWLAMLKELLPKNQNEIRDLILEAEEICKIISSTILTLKGKKSL